MLLMDVLRFLGMVMQNLRKVFMMYLSSRAGVDEERIISYITTFLCYPKMLCGTCNEVFLPNMFVDSGGSRL